MPQYASLKEVYPDTDFTNDRTDCSRSFNVFDYPHSYPPPGPYGPPVLDGGNRNVGNRGLRRIRNSSTLDNMNKSGTLLEGFESDGTPVKRISNRDLHLRVQPRFDSTLGGVPDYTPKYYDPHGSRRFNKRSLDNDTRINAKVYPNDSPGRRYNNVPKYYSDTNYYSLEKDVQPVLSNGKVENFCSVGAPGDSENAHLLSPDMEQELEEAVNGLNCETVLGHIRKCYKCKSQIKYLISDEKENTIEFFDKGQNSNNKVRTRVDDLLEILTFIGAGIFLIFILDLFVSIGQRKR